MGIASGGIWTMIKLSKGIEPGQISREIASLVKKHMKNEPENKLSFLLQPLSDIHFNADYSSDDIRKAHLPALYGLMGISLFILIIGVVNFINLSTAQLIQRVKEIGIRKVLGSNRANLVFQFLTETAIIVFFAVCVAVIAVKPLLAAFHDLIPPEVSFTFFNIHTLLFLLSIIIATSLFAGFYPARMLAGQEPIAGLKGQIALGMGKKWLLRKTLIVFQFSISLVFIICTLIMGSQVRFMLNSDSGLNTGGVVDLFPRAENSNKLRAFEQKLKQIPGIEKVALQVMIPTGWRQGLKKLH
jgi:hypothetical protein